MDNNHLFHELRKMAQSVKALENELIQIESLEIAIRTTKDNLIAQINILRNSICAILGGISANQKFEDIFADFDYEYRYQSPIAQQLNTLGNGYDNQPTYKSPKQIIEEIKAMIVELHIKGSVRKRPDGRFEYRSALLGSIYGKTKEEIEQKLTQKLKEVKRNKGKPFGKKKEIPLLSDFFISQYLPYKQNQERSEASIKSYHSLFGYIERAKFDKPLNQYKPKEIEDFLYSIPHSRTRQMLQGFFNNMFKRAMTLGLAKVNPCASIEKVKHTQEQGTTFSFDEQREFFDLLRTTDKLTYSEKCYLTFIYLTGTRKEEAAEVCFKDIDFKNKVLTIRGTKTDGSYRQMPLAPLVEKLLLSMNVVSDKYFHFTESHLGKIFRKVWEKSKGHKLHDLRHTYGTIQICVEKIDVKTVSLVMGHSTVNTTLAIYTHPEQLDRGTFLRGDLATDEKLAIYRSKYQEIICQVNSIIQ